MDLRAGGSGGHTTVTSAVGLSIALMTGSEPVEGVDVVAEFLDSFDPAKAQA